MTPIQIPLLIIHMISDESVCRCAAFLDPGYISVGPPFRRITCMYMERGNRYLVGVKAEDFPRYSVSGRRMI